MHQLFTITLMIDISLFNSVIYIPRTLMLRTKHTKYFCNKQTTVKLLFSLLYIYEPHWNTLMYKGSDNLFIVCRKIQHTLYMLYSMMIIKVFYWNVETVRFKPSDLEYFQCHFISSYFGFACISWYANNKNVYVYICVWIIIWHKAILRRY